MNTIRKLSAGLLCAASAFAISAEAVAQTQNVESVVVTGSRVISDITNSPTPLTVVTADQLETTTPTTVADALNKLPVFAGSGNLRDQTGGGGYDGNALNLRNFGVSRTLVLFDGHRVPSTSQDGSVDIDVLPQMLMSRVDIVTGGASAVYGSDAITGVVNFVLDKNFNGFKYNANAGISGRGLGANQQVGIAAGTDIFGGRGHIEGSLKYYRADPVKMIDLPYGPGFYAPVGDATDPKNPVTLIANTRNFENAAGAVSSCGTGCAAAGMQFVSPGVLGAYNQGQPTAFSFVRSGGEGGFAIHPTAQSGLKNYESFLRASYNLNDTTTAYVQGALVQSKYISTYYDPNIDSGVDQNVFFKNNPFLSASAQALLNTGTGNTFTIEKLYDNLPPLQNQGVSTNISVTAGLDGTLGGRFNWDLYYTHGESRLSETNIHDVNNAKLMASEDAVLNSSGQAVCYVSTVPAYAALYPGCEPLNLFGRGTTTVSSENYWAPNTFFIQTNVLDDLGGSISGDIFDLPAGAVKAALSGEARWNSLAVNSPSGAAATPVNCTGLRLCPATPVGTWAFASVASLPTVSQSVWEFAAEVNAPLLKDMPLVQSLDLNLAGRYTDYSSSGSVQTWKIGLDWHFNDDIRLRATNSVDIRAPTLTNLYGPFQSSVCFVDDTRHTGSQGNTTCQTGGGNPALVPEVSRTYTAGVVLTPTFVRNLTVSLDYYQIHMSNALTGVSGDDPTIRNLCEDTTPTYSSPYCSLLVRPLAYSNRTPANFPTLIENHLVNSASQRISGVDFEVDYNFDIADIWSQLAGTVALRQLVNYQPEDQTQSFSFSPPLYDAHSKTRATTFFTYNIGDWGFTVENQWLSSWKKQTIIAPQYYAQPRVPSFDAVDLTIDRKMDFAGGMADVYLSVQNLTDNPGPLWGGLPGAPGFFYPVGGTYAEADRTTYPVLGRMFTIGVRGNF